MYKCTLVRQSAPSNSEKTSDGRHFGFDRFYNKKLWKIKRYKNKLFVAKLT